MFPSEKIQDSILESIKKTKGWDVFILILLGFFILMTLWFLSIFLLAPTFYLKNPIWLTILFAFIFSCGNFGLSLRIVITKEKDTNDFLPLFLFTVIDAISSIGFLFGWTTILDYYYPFITYHSLTPIHSLTIFNYRWFVAIVFIYLNVRGMITVLYYLFINKIKKMKKKNNSDDNGQPK